jgi:hypothetical protein
MVQETAMVETGDRYPDVIAAGNRNAMIASEIQDIII